MKRTPARVTRRLFGITLLVTICTAPHPVSAHATLVSSSPSPSAVLETSPEEIVLDFSEPVSLIDRSIRVFDENRDLVSIDGLEMIGAAQVRTRSLALMDPGLYLVSWRVLSADGHVAEGAFTFQIGSTSPTVTPAELLDSAGRSPDVYGLSVVGVIARLAVFVGLCAALGTALFTIAAGQWSRRTRVVVTLGWVLSIVGTALHFAVQGVVASGTTWANIVSLSAWSDVHDTRFGKALVLRLVLLVPYLGGLVVAWKRPLASTTSWWRSSMVLLGAGVLATLASAGHPSASSHAGVAAAMDGLHFAAVVLWLGGLLTIFLHSSHEEIVKTVSRVASVAAPIVLVTGIWQAWHLHGGLSELTTSQWGRTLIFKSSVAVAVVTVGAVAHWLVRESRGASLRRLIVLEAALALVVLAATASMVTAPPRLGAQSSVFTTTLAQGDVLASITLTPGRVGTNEIHLSIITSGGSLEVVDGVRMRMTKSSSDIGAVEVAVTTLGPNHFLGTVSLLEAGTWNMEVLVQVTESRLVRFSTTVTI